MFTAADAVENVRQAAAAAIPAFRSKPETWCVFLPAKNKISLNDSCQAYI
jgi:hypothetical protein